MYIFHFFYIDNDTDKHKYTITQISYSYFYTLYSGNTNGNMYISVCAKTYVLYSCVCKNLCLIFLCVRKLTSYILVFAKTYVLYSYVCKNVCFISWWCVGKRLAAFSRNNTGIMFYDITDVLFKMTIYRERQIQENIVLPSYFFMRYKYF